jgi:holliday junction DNA helicase RuvA
MIGRLRGILVEKHPNLAVVECGGVGYACAISLGTYGLLAEVGSETTLHVETLLRENELALLGFSSRDERELYRMLVKVDGIGPKLALAALGALPHEDLLLAIRGRDIKALQRIPGVGRKTAEKVCFELSEKMGGLSGLEGLAPSVSAAGSWESDLLSALVNLGFKDDAVRPIVAQLRTEQPPMPEAIRAALKALRK